MLRKSAIRQDLNRSFVENTPSGAGESVETRIVRKRLCISYRKHASLACENATVNDEKTFAINNVL